MKFLSVTEVEPDLKKEIIRMYRDFFHEIYSLVGSEDISYERPLLVIYHSQKPIKEAELESIENPRLREGVKNATRQYSGFLIPDKKENFSVIGYDLYFQEIILYF